MRIHVLDVGCEDCGARSGTECVKPNGHPLARSYSGGIRGDGPIRWTWTRSSGEVVEEWGRPTTYHAARIALFKHARALAELGAHARA